MTTKLQEARLKTRRERRIAAGVEQALGAEIRVRDQRIAELEAKAPPITAPRADRSLQETNAPARSTASQLYLATEILADLLRRAWQCEQVTYHALDRPDDDVALDVHGARQANAILCSDLEHISQQCIEYGLLNTSGEITVSVEIA